MDTAATIAHAVLYDGYILWPYRRAARNSLESGASGCVFPERWSSTSGTTDPGVRRTTVLVKGKPETAVDVSIRFLQIMHRQATTMTPTGLEDIDDLMVAGEHYVSWEEAIEREASMPRVTISELATTRAITIAIDAGQDLEPLMTDDGRIAGFIRRTWREIEGRLEVSSVRVRPGLYRLSARVMNATSFDGTARAEALHHSMASAHLVFHVDGGSFVSLQHPPAALRSVARDCQPDGLWPILVGDATTTNTMLAAPVLLSDYPRVAS